MTTVPSLGKVAVLMGGDSAEREVSLMSGAGVLAALRAVGVDAHPFDPAERALGELKAEGCTRAFVALHGRHGEDGTVQGALELLGIPYTGSGVLASALAIDKTTTKRLWAAEGLATPRWVLLRGAELEPGSIDAAAEAAATALGLPLIVKPPREGSSIGVTRVDRPEQLPAAVRAAAGHDSEVLCEECIVGDELTCAVLGEADAAEALPVIRICAPGGDYDYRHKYFTDDVRYLVPSGLPPAEEDEVRRLTLAAYRALGCRGWGRADLMLRASDRRPFLLEMNTSPGMTGHSLVPMAARAAGLSYEQLCLRVLAAARLDTPPGLAAL
jgi:D-alanine-D-alanine ligase